PDPIWRVLSACYCDTQALIFRLSMPSPYTDNIFLVFDNLDWSLRVGTCCCIAAVCCLATCFNFTQSDCLLCFTGIETTLHRARAFHIINQLEIGTSMPYRTSRLLGILSRSMPS